MKKIWMVSVVYCSVITALFLCTNTFSRAVTALAESRPIAGRYCIVIDPGHGGEDGGAVSHSGFPESTYNLEIALKLNDLLNLLGFNTEMIRKTDTSVYTRGETLAQKKASDLRERVKTANEAANAILVSIHQNHYPDEQYSGAQVFYAKTDKSESLAKQLQSAFAESLNPGSRRQAKKATGIYLMEHINCPGILVECGFLSNSAEDARLKDPEYQRKLCCVIAATLSQFLSNT